MWMWACVHARACMRAWVCACVRVRVRVCVCTCVLVRVHLRSRACARALADACVHASAHLIVCMCICALCVCTCQSACMGNAGMCTFDMRVCACLYTGPQRIVMTVTSVAWPLVVALRAITPPTRTTCASSSQVMRTVW